MRTYSLAPEDWPAVDRAAWELVTTPTRSRFGPHRHVRKRRPDSIRMACVTYGTWLSFLSRTAQLDPDVSPVARITPELLDDWVEEQKARGVQNSTIKIRMRDLRRMMLLIAPEADTKFIIRPGGMSLDEAWPDEPRERCHFNVQAVFDRAIALFESAQAGLANSSSQCPERDAALFGLLSGRAPRIASIAAMRLGEHLYRREGLWFVTIPPEDMKTGKPVTFRLPPRLQPVFDCYIERVRPAMEGALSTDRIWMGTKKTALTKASVGNIVRRRMMEWYGVKVGPHAFRRFLTTTVAMEAPELLPDIADLLCHCTRTQAKSYNEAKVNRAAKRYSDLIDRLEKEAERAEAPMLRRRHGAGRRVRG